MKSSVAIVLVALVSFSLGWGVGRSSAGDGELTERVAALEGRLDGLFAAAGQPPGARPAPAAPERQTVDIDGAPTRGPESAAITLVEFSDFECPFCLRANPTIEKLRAEYPEQLRVVFKHFPLAFHERAMNAHRAVVAAEKQGKFWEMHDRIFATPRDLDAEHMRAHAESLGLDLARFDSDFESDEASERVDQDIAQGQKLGVRGTPAFFINGRLVSGAQPYAVFKQVIEEELSEKS